MLKSLELKNSIKDLKIEIEDGIKNKIDMSSKAEELDQLIGEYQEALEKENKIKNKNNKEISKVENRKSFNRALKNLLIGKEVQEQDKQFMPKVVDAAGQYVAAGTPGAGAYLVSEEFLPLHKHNAGTVDLAQYCRTINVSKPAGKVPTLDLSQNIELADFAVDNEAEIAKKSAVFDQVPYTCKNKGAIIPVGLDLIEDADVDVVAAIHELFDVAKTRARNAEIIAAAKTGATEVTGVDFAAIDLADAIKTALNEKLSTTYAANAKIFVGQATYNKLATLKDGNDNYILQPVLAAPGKYAVDGHEVVVLDTVYGLNDVIVGDFNQILNIERKGFEVSSDLSSGFKTYSLNIRAVARYTELNVAPKAFVVIKSA
jgi:HK97 family phage major capsid protein